MDELDHWEVTFVKKKLMLIDGNSVAYRAFYALPLLHNEKGVYTNAIYGFTTMLMKLLEEEKPTHILVAFDAGKTTFRHKTFQEYKGGRQQTPPELSEQFPFLRELLDAYGIRQYELEHYEADDIIGTLAVKAEKDGYEVKVISGDKDLTQLTSEHITVGITKKGIADVDIYTPEHVMETYGIAPGQIVDMKGLMGDQSDNIPGVPGIGQKTAVKLLKEFGTLERLLESIDKVSGAKLKERLEEFGEQARMSKQLATIETEAPVDISLDDLEFKGYDPANLSAVFRELEFNSLLDKIEGGQSVPEDIEMAQIEYRMPEKIDDSLFTEQMSGGRHSCRQMPRLIPKPLKNGPKTRRRRNSFMMPSVPSWP
jgi:DNA polymerase-1